MLPATAHQAAPAHSLAVGHARLQARHRFDSKFSGVRAAILLLFAALAFSAPSFAQTNDWLGTTGTTGNWSDATKWSTGTVANGSTDISIATGTVNGNFSINTLNGFQLTIGAPATLNILSSTDLNVGEAQITSSGLVNNSGVVNNSAFLNSGILNNSGTMTNYFLANSAGATINNSGTLVEANKAISNDGTFNNSGGITASGILNVAGATVKNTGAIVFIVNTPGFFSEAYNYGAFTNQATGVITNSGIFENYSGGTLTNLGTINDTVALSNEGTFNNGGTYTVTATGDSFNGGQLNNTGLFHITAGGTYLSYGGIANAAGAQITNDGQFDSAKGQTVANAGTITNTGSWRNGSVFVNTGVVNNNGSFQNDESTVQIAAGGVFNNNLSGSVSNTAGAVFTVSNGGTLNNSGTFNVDSASTFTMAAGSIVLNSSTGQMNLSSGTLQVVAAGKLVNNGTITMVGGMGPGGFILPPPTLVIAQTGALSGTGFIVGAVTNFGTVTPGNSTGTLTIDGLYQQMAGSTLDMLLGGTGSGEFSQLDVNGEAVLGGTLDVELYNGFDPASGEVFELLSGKISGTFAAVDLPTLTDGLFFKLDQEANGIFLDVDGTKTGGGGNGGGNGTMPEPASFLLLGFGLASLAAMNFWRARGGAGIRRPQD